MGFAFILCNMSSGTLKLAQGRSSIRLQNMEIISCTWSSKWKRKRGLNHDYQQSFSLLDLILGGLSWGLALGTEGWSLLTSFIVSGTERLPRRTVWIPVCLSVLKLRLCQDVVIRCVSPLPSCQLFLQNFSSPFSNKSFLLLSFPRKI